MASDADMVGFLKRLLSSSATFIAKHTASHADMVGFLKRLLASSTTFVAKHTASDADMVGLLKRLLSPSDPVDAPRFLRSFNWIMDDESMGFVAFLSLALCVVLGVSFVLIVAFKVCRYISGRACSWVYRCTPWSRASELRRREKDVELREALNARKARTLTLDVEIGVCKGLLETLKHSVAAAEERASELQKEKLLLSQEVLREGNEAPGKKMVRRRAPTMLE
ncbi:hypothetical protein FB446DRAFT_790633 [Lentinula raphanica]|nr:hypothetical protein FB446DRAFT_790633 [Lentinula raphanica]